MDNPHPSHPSRILVAMGAFKGTFTNLESTTIVADVLEKAGFAVSRFPIADGGAGSSLPFEIGRPGKRQPFQTTNLLNKPVTANVLLGPEGSSPTFAFIESSEVCGYGQNYAGPRNALDATSTGLGRLLSAVLKTHPTLREIFIGLGDSGISDAGVGMLHSLGFTFLNNDDNLFSPSAATLGEIKSIKAPTNHPVLSIPLTVLCDVTNPLCGPNGSAAVFSPQKGATPSEVAMLSEGMEKFAIAVHKATGKVVKDREHCGSAGGLAAAFYGLLNTKLVPGADYLLGMSHFDDLVKACDLVVVGEGKTDLQTLQRKAPFEVLKRATAAGLPVAVLSGAITLTEAERLNFPPATLWFEAGKLPTPIRALESAALKLAMSVKLGR